VLLSLVAVIKRLRFDLPKYGETFETTESDKTESWKGYNIVEQRGGANHQNLKRRRKMATVSNLTIQNSLAITSHCTAL
jgi:hypothetical protein